MDPGQADSVGYFIPYRIVEHFLDDIERHKQYTGFPTCGFRWQRMESKALRRALGMKPNESGILVKWVSETSDAARVLRKGDIITHVDGISVSNAGTVPFRSGERIGLNFMVTSKFSYASMAVTFLRDGEIHEDSYLLPSMADDRLVSVHDAQQHRRQPEYVLFGGLLFQVLSEPFLRAVYGQNWILEAPVRLIDEYYRGTKTRAGRSEIVVLAQVLATETTSGYEEEGGSDVIILKRVNGAEVNSLRHLADLIDGCSPDTEFLQFELDNMNTLILDRQAAIDEEQSTLSTHCIPAARSFGAEFTSQSKPEI